MLTIQFYVLFDLIAIGKKLLLVDCNKEVWIKGDVNKKECEYKEYEYKGSANKGVWI